MPYFRKISKFTYFNTSRCVHSKSINGATPLLYASIHLDTHKHHLSPGFNPGNPFLGVIKSLPFLYVKCKKSFVTIAQTMCAFVVIV